MLESLLDRFQQAASALPDPRTGSNKRYAVSDAAACALSTFFFQSPSFLDFQRHMLLALGLFRPDTPVFSRIALTPE